MKKIRIAVVGANGVPPSYGGWDQLVEHFSRFKADDVTFVIYSSYLTGAVNISRYNEAEVRVIDLNANGYQSIAFDIVSLAYAFRDCDAAILLGTSGAFALPILKFLRFPVITNIDGLEWKRGKWNPVIKYILLLLERLAVRYSRVVITDNDILKKYVLDKYSISTKVIAYGGDHVNVINPAINIKKLNLVPKAYAFKVCRVVPENNLDLILEVFQNTKLVLIVVGNFRSTKYGRALIKKFGRCQNIIMHDPIYEQNTLDELRSNCGIYIHGHSVGGTNPSLVEAMSLGLNIAAYDVNFNRSTANNTVHFFSNKEQLKKLLIKFSCGELNDLGPTARVLAKEKYNWNKIINDYVETVKVILGNHRSINDSLIKH